MRINSSIPNPWPEIWITSRKPYPLLSRANILFVILFSVAYPLFTFQTAYAAIAFRSASSASNGSGATSLTITTPAGATVGDVLIMSGEARANSEPNIIPGAEWNVIDRSYGTSIYKSTYYTVLTAVPPASYTINFTSMTTFGPVSVKATAGIIAYSGVDGANPIMASNAQVNASSTTMTAPSVTTNAANTMIVALYGAGVGTTATQGSSMTERYDVASSGGGVATRTTSAGQDAVQGTSGASGVKTMTIAASADSVGVTVALKPGAAAATPSLAQEAYRFYQNADSATPGTALAAANTASSITAATPFRLRLLLDVSSANLAAGASNFVLQAGEKVSTCNAATYTSASNFFNNASIADNAAITTNANDPQAVGGGAQEVAQTYNENNAFTSTTVVTTGDSGLWDFSLTSLSGDAGKTYCFRVTYSDGTPLSSYMVYPEISFTSPPPTGPTLNQQLRGGQSVIDGVKQPFSF